MPGYWTGMGIATAAARQACKAAAYRLWFGVGVFLWKAGMRRLRWRRVRILQMDVKVYAEGGALQPDGQCYPDSTRVVMRVAVKVPRHPDAYPLSLSLWLRGSDGRPTLLDHQVHATVARTPLTIEISFDDLSDILPAPGHWSVEVVLDNTRRLLGRATFRVVGREDLLADLGLERASLTVAREGAAETGRIVFADADHALPYAEIRPRTCHPSKYDGMTLSVRLLCKPTGRVHASYEMPLAFRDGLMRVNGLTLQPARLGRIPAGDWELAFAVHGHRIGGISFAFVYPEQARRSVRADGFEVRLMDGSVIASGASVQCISTRVRSVAAVARLGCLYPSAVFTYDASVLLCVDGRPVGEIPMPVRLPGTAAEVAFGEIEVPPMPVAHDPLSLEILLLLEGRVQGCCVIILVPPPVAFTDVQGRLVAPDYLDQTLDYTSEARRILEEARAG